MKNIASQKEVAIGKEEVFQFAIEGVGGMVDDVDRVASWATQFVPDKINSSDPYILSSFQGLNYNNQDHMVSFRFSQKARTDSGIDSEIYLIAFDDGQGDRNIADFNDYIIEVRLVEPATTAK